MRKIVYFFPLKETENPLNNRTIQNDFSWWWKIHLTLMLFFFFFFVFFPFLRPIIVITEMESRKKSLPQFFKNSSNEKLISFQSIKLHSLAFFSSSFAIDCLNMNWLLNIENPSKIVRHLEQKSSFIVIWAPPPKKGGGILFQQSSREVVEITIGRAVCDDRRFFCNLIECAPSSRNRKSLHKLMWR